MTTLETLRQLLADGSFHHATYRDFGTVWEGLWIYAKSPLGFGGFAPAGCFGKDHPDLKMAETLTRGTGVSVGAYGRG